MTDTIGWKNTNWSANSNVTPFAKQVFHPRTHIFFVVVVEVCKREVRHKTRSVICNKPVNELCVRWSLGSVYYQERATTWYSKYEKENKYSYFGMQISFQVYLCVNARSFEYAGVRDCLNVCLLFSISFCISSICIIFKFEFVWEKEFDTLL